MIQRLGEERDMDVCERITEALVSIGEPAVADLIALVRKRDIVRAEFAVRALANIGTSAAETLASLLPTITHERTRNILVAVLAEMGPGAAPAVPVLAQMLDETLDDQLALYVVMALWSCDAAAPAIPALIRCLRARESGEDQIAILIGRTLAQLREQAIPALQDALTDAVGTERELIERTLAILGISQSGKWAYLEDMQCDDLIAIFIEVGDLLEEDAISWRKLSALIEEKEREGRLAFADFGMSPNSLRNYVTDLGTKLGCSLTTHGEKKKGGLSDDGRRVLSNANAYLQAKAARRNRPIT